MSAAQTQSPPNPTTSTRRVAAARPRLLQVAAAVVVLAVATAALVVASSGTPAAAGLVRDAAERLATADSLRVSLVQTYPDGEVWSFDGEFVGADGRQVGMQRAADGTVLSTWELVVIGDTLWTVADGEVHRQLLGPDERLEPFARASAAVIEAAVVGGAVADLGADPAMGEETTRYRIVPDERSTAALAALAPGELSWFELEDPAAVATIHVWVARERIRRVEVEFVPGHHLRTSTAEFLDAGGPVTIEAPEPS